MPAGNRTNRRGFTLIELLVVVAIIALLVSILLPSLKSAREQARAAKCGVNLKSMGTGLATYFSEFNDWIPGPNTSGIPPRLAKRLGDENTLRRAYVPTQSFDWMSPSMHYETELGSNRAERLLTLINEYGCPSVQALSIDFLYDGGLAASPDRDDFDQDELLAQYAPLSYLMPAHFQWWGLNYTGTTVASALSPTGRVITIRARTTYDFFSTETREYQSRLNMVGAPARKIAAADGTRYVLENGDVDFDVDPDPDYFGCFASNGAWYAGSQAYGVRQGTANWNGTSVAAGSLSGGQNLAWSYRHGGSGGASASANDVRSNAGEINALFFDGHVARLDDRASREIEYWYPSGTTVVNLGDGLTDLPMDYEVP
jgi:prepilin-type N-terminal cleavage/methylation domain-containing protein/prepilin-type processing-associated H-X9-DG protein